MTGTLLNRSQRKRETEKERENESCMDQHCVDTVVLFLSLGILKPWLMNEGFDK